VSMRFPFGNSLIGNFFGLSHGVWDEMRLVGGLWGG
jgi:hypothetical protein